jgi:protein TonB
VNDPHLPAKVAQSVGGRLQRPKLGLPVARENRWTGPATSFLLHALLLAIVLWPASNELFDLDQEGAGGPGPAGGGGGGMGGTGGITNNPERLQYYIIAPQPVIAPPVEEEKPEEVVVPPPEPTPPEVVAVPDTVKSSAVDLASNTAGVGGGSGSDGTAGTGPGTGGGVGSGDGPGRGSGVGPGTGGGMGTVYPATPTTVVILPIPVPSRVKPYELVAQFEVDSLGRSRLLRWTQSRDDGYNRKVEASLKGYKFRPAVTLDGVTVVDTVEIRAWAR